MYSIKRSEADYFGNLCVLISTVINAGDLLASLTLKDPSKVKKILTFSGDFDIPMESYEFSVKDAVKNNFSGYGSDPEAIAAAAF